MGKLTDWSRDAAEEIYTGGDTSVETIREIIVKHCPFKQGIAYEEVQERQDPTLVELVDAFVGWWSLNREGSVNAAYQRIDEFVKSAREATEWLDILRRMGPKPS